MMNNKFAVRIPPAIFELDMKNDDDILDYISYKCDFSEYEDKAVRKKINFKSTLKKNLKENHLSNQTILYDMIKREIKIRRVNVDQVIKLKQQIKDKDDEILSMKDILGKDIDRNHKNIEEKYKIMKSAYSKMQENMINYNHFIDFIKNDKKIMWDFQSYIHDNTGNIIPSESFIKDFHKKEDDEKIEEDSWY